MKLREVQNRLIPVMKDANKHQSYKYYLLAKLAFA